MKFISSIFLLTFLVVAFSQNYSGCTGTVNNQPVFNIQPTLINSTAHGKRFFVQDPNNSQIFAHIAVLEGSAYEMGYAMGTLFHNEINESMTAFTDFLFGIGQLLVQAFPAWMLGWELSDESIMQMGLHIEEIATNHYTPKRFLEELQGISDATGVPFSQLLQVNLFPELTRATCTILGAWGPATSNGNLYHLRALDFLATAPFNYYSAVTVYRSTEKNAQPFANFGWLGMIGSLAGYNGLVGIGERVYDVTDDDHTTIFGEPWMFVVRDVVQFGYNLESAYEILNNANRTYEILLGVGSKPDNSFRGFLYNYAELNMYTDTNWTGGFDSDHPQLDGIVYWDKGDGNPCMANIIESYYGNVTPAMMYQEITALRQSGDTLVAVYDYDANLVYVSFATNFQPAYNNPLFLLNMTDLFTMPINETS